MWPIQLQVVRCIVCRIFISCLTARNTASFLSHDQIIWSSLSFSTSTHKIFQGICVILHEVSKIQHYTTPRTNCSISPVYSLYLSPNCNLNLSPNCMDHLSRKSWLIPDALTGRLAMQPVLNTCSYGGSSPVFWPFIDVMMFCEE